MKDGKKRTYVFELGKKKCFKVYNICELIFKDAVTFCKFCEFVVKVA